MTLDEQLTNFGVSVEHCYAKATKIPAGVTLTQHAHDFDHESVLAAGTVRLVVDGKSQTLNAPKCILIQAGKVHEVQALTDARWFCIWPEGMGV